MKKNIIAGIFLLSVFICNGQEKNDSLKTSATTPEARKKFYTYYLPTSIAKLDFAPGIISSISMDFGDDEISFKAGSPFDTTTDATLLKSSSDKSFKNSWFTGGSIIAEDGVSKFFSSGKFNPGYSIKGGLTFKTKETRWHYTGYPDSTSSRKFNWINIVAKINWTRYNIFATDSTYKKETPMGFQVVAFYNNYFHSRIPKYKPANSIYSIGLGFGRFNNYKLLDDEFTLLEGRPVSNGNFIKTDEVKGKKGSLKNFYSAAYAVDYFKSIIRSEKATLYFGLRANGFIGKYGNINTSGGLYFSGTGVNQKGEKEEKFGFVIAGNFPNTQKFDWDTYLRKKAFLSFSATIPLRFSL